MKKDSLTIVIPSYNEMANLQKGVLEKINDYLKEKKNLDWDVIVVDDGSNDGSEEFVERFVKNHSNFKLIKNDHMGKAGAVTTGILQAKGDYRLFTDMDQATPIDQLDKLIPYMKDYDVVIGSRSSKRKGAPFTRLIMARGMILLRTVIVGLNGIGDTQCGFKMFKAKSAEKIFSKVKELHHGFKHISGSSVTAGFDIELLYLARKMGFRIKEVPVDWLYVETRRVSPIKDSIDGVLDLFRIKMNAINGKYK